MSLKRFNLEGLTGIHLFFFPRHPPSQLVSVHSPSRHDCNPVGGRFQWANQTAAADFPGSCQWGCKGTEGTVWLTICVQRWINCDFLIVCHSFPNWRSLTAPLFSAFFFFFYRTSTCVSAACLCQKLTSPLPASMWPRPTAGLWKSCVWRSMSPPPRVPRWMPAVLE